MSIKGEWIRYGKGSGYFARPEKTGTGSPLGQLPAVLVIQEIGGVNSQIEAVTQRIAAAGYAALAPDLFAVDGVKPPALSAERVSEAFGTAGRFPPGTMFDKTSREAALATLPEAERLRIAETFAQVFSFASPDRLMSLIDPLKMAFRHLREERPETKGQKVACVGFCMGGGLSALLACEEEELSGAAVFYGNGPTPERIQRINCPVIFFYGTGDQRVSAGVPAFREAMRAAGKSFEEHAYQGAGHSFFNEDAPSYDVAAVRDSYARLLGFFARVLSG